MYLVDKQDVAIFEAGEDSREVARFLDDGTRRDDEVSSHGLGEDICQCGFAEAWRAAEEAVAEELSALTGSSDHHLKAFFDVILPDEFS